MNKNIKNTNKNTNKKINIFYILSILLIISGIIIALIYYPIMPDKMITHWNINNVPDGYSSKLTALFLSPIISLVLFVLFLILPKLDPLKVNYIKFKNYYNGFIVLFLFFLFYIQILSLIYNLGYIFNFGAYMIPALFLLFYYCGILIEKAQQNWFVGIRTPWTLSNKKNWIKTHKFGSVLFKISSIMMLVGLFFERYLIYFVLIPIFTSVIITFIYSYILSKKFK
jgi:uncharacterized membrane protein